MNNKELSIILRLRDEATKRLEGFKGNMQRFANTWKENWLGISATVTAAFMAMQKAWDYMELGAKAEQIETSFRSMAEGMGMDAQKLKTALEEASAGTADFSDVADKVSGLIANGLGADQIVALMKQARVEARIFGTTTVEAFDSIAKAVESGAFKSLKRTYGLQISLKDAVASYAEATGKSTEEVQKHYQAQAIANAILAQGKVHMAAVNTELMTNYEKVQALKAKWHEFSEKIGQALWKVLGFLQGFMYQIFTGFYALLEYVMSIFQKMLSPVIKFCDLLGKLPSVFGAVYRGVSSELKKINESLEVYKNAFAMGAEENAKKALEQYDLVFSKAKDTGDKTSGILKEVARQVREESDATGNALKNVSQKVKENVQEAAQGFNAMLEFARQTAHNMENAFSDLFFKAFTGELNSVKEVFASFGKAMLQTISNILARIVMIKILTAAAGPAGSIAGIPISKLFHTGGMVRKHQGGMIYAHEGLAPDEIPIIAQTGEGVLSRKGMNALGGSDTLRQLNDGKSLQQPSVTVNVTQVIQAWDSQDVWRNRKALSSAIADDIYNNGKIRSVIRNYT